MTGFHTHPDPPWPYGGRRHAHPQLFEAALRIEGLCARYPRAEKPAISDVTFELPEGCLAALVGPNGAGKSTVLKAVAGLLAPSDGAIRIFGLAPGGCHHRTAYLPQRGEIDWRFPVTVARFVLAGRYVHLGWGKWPRRIDAVLVGRALDRLGIAALSDRGIGELSGGQQQRALVARALVQGADLMLLDEPFNNLDAETRDELLSLMAELRDAGKTFLVATHDFAAPETAFDSVIRMRDGRRQPNAVRA